MTLATKGTFNLWSQSFPTVKWFTVNGPVFLHLYYDVMNDHQERYLPVHLGNYFVNTVDSRKLEPSREIQKSSSYWEFELSGARRK